ncbi:MAG: low-specificity L-threonine aldolase [Deltaproteobacteria bacterium]|nr:low-specificity L-threonine aldolase [Deltaproteobacteria bacterium]MBW2070352.1 low-specificity L-threonine aldolase [Deltaproteobacteria bacterium]
MIDLRSDTVTRPQQAMRQAMAAAEVGDDVFGEDPTVNLLQERMAALLGKEAGLFLPSGTMANQVAIKSHIQPGDEVIIDDNAHIFFYECGATAVISGGQFRCLPGNRGILSAESVAAAIRPPDIHHPVSRLVCLENSHNRGGGSIYPKEELRAIYQTAREHGLAVHLDGARLFNAAQASGIEPAALANYADSVCVSLSKGLGAPAGSVLCGSVSFIDRARKIRKMLGGGMRQVGILAAAGLYALDHNLQRLSEDHQKAKQLAAGLSRLPGIQLEEEAVVTNIVMFDVTETGLSAADFVEKIAAQGVLMIPFGPRTVRAVTHLDVSSADIEAALTIMQHLFSA